MATSKDIIGMLSNDGEDFIVSQPPMDRSKLRNLLLNFKSIAPSIPWKALEDMGWINIGDRSLSQIAPYFLSSVNNSKILYRKSIDKETFEIFLWKARVHMRAMTILAENPQIKYKAGSIDAEFLQELVKLSKDPLLLSTLPEILCKNGILLIFEKGLPSIKTDGLVYRTGNGVPVVALTLRYSRLDNFWFTLLHELSHVVKHYDLLDDAIVEDLDSLPDSKIEKQADRLAKNTIVPRFIWERCEVKYTHELESVIKLAEQLDIHPALIAGMVRRELKNYTLFSNLINEVNTREIIFGER
jgi:HTH-type transcriptional regulator/antitoxin HigA